MSSALPSNECCPECDPIVTQGVPGPQGAAGANGTNGSPGANSFTHLTAGYIQPAANANVTVAVADSTWAGNNQYIYIQGGGHYQVQSVPDTTHLIVKNLNYSLTGTAVPGTVVGSGQIVTPAGAQGATGATGSTTFNSLSPTIAKGDIIVDNGVNAPLASDVRLAVGTNGKRLRANSAVAAGLDWALVDLASATEVTGVAPIANGGTGGATAAAARTALAVLPLAGGTLTGSLGITSAGAQLQLNDSSSAADNRIWEIKAATDQLQFRIWNDALGAVTLWAYVDRTGTVVDSITLPFGNLVCQGGLVLDNACALYSKQAINSALAAGNNNNVAFGSGTYFKIKAGPAGAFAITGISDIGDGRQLILHNATGQAMTLTNESALSVASNRITTLTGADYVTTGDGFVRLIYDADSARWVIMSTVA